MRNTGLAAATLLLIVAVPATTAAQTLAEVARQEEARRKGISKPARVLTNEDLRRVAPALQAPVEAPAPVPAAAEPAAAEPREEAPTPAADRAAPSPTDQVSPPDDPAMQEEAWRTRITNARAALERTKVLLGAMQSRINQLWADFTARDDPYQRTHLAKDREAALAELARLQQDEKDQAKAIADIETEARQKGIPPGWLR